MRAIVGTVKSNEDVTTNGTLSVQFTDLFDGREQNVTYTSPYFRVNGGGFVAIPEVEDQILVFWNEELAPGEKLFYYISTIITSKVFSGDDKPNPDFKPLRSNDSKATIYNESSKPVTQTFTNPVGAGLYIQRDFQENGISNNVTLKAESGDEVNLGPLGFQVRNAQGDSIVLTGSNPNDSYAAQSLAIETLSNQEYKCTSADIKMKVVDGGDINIENDSTGLFSISGKWFGNVRLKSAYRNVDLAALGPTSNVNIITNTAKIKVNGATGQIEIFGNTDVSVNSAGSLSLNAGANVTVNSGGDLSLNALGATRVNGSTISLNNQQITTMNPTGGDVSVVQPVPPNASPSPPDILPPESNDYNDGFVGPEAPGGV